MRNLDRLATLAGIEESYWDIFGVFHQINDHAKMSILSAMGFSVGSPEAVDESLREFNERPWRRLLEPVVIMRSGSVFAAPLTLPQDLWQGEVRWRVAAEDGSVVEGRFHPVDQTPSDMRDVNGGTMARFSLPLPADLGQGYHRLFISAGDSKAETVLIIAPPKAYAPSWLEEGRRLWGIACHLYSLRSESNWGIGDFTDLAELSRITAVLGGTSVGVNPLHALFSMHPDHASPYSPSSRRFLNPLYIDAIAASEFQDCPEVRALVATPGFAEHLGKVRAADYVDYSAVSAGKLMMLERMYELFAERNPPVRSAFDDFVNEGGTALHHFVLFQALHEHFHGRPWSEWPHAYSSPDADGAQAFAVANAHRLEFHAYLQWLADEQLAAAACAGEGMEVGLYADLAIGTDQNGADAWSDSGSIVHGARFGAPPDAFNAQGQDWGMPPFHPHNLREEAYEPFIQILRANMRHAGALRVDHVMGLMRLYWIPPGEKADSGAYVRYPFDDLLAILALESVRNKCLVIGEDLGTVPDGFRERMAKEGALSYRVLRFERYPDGLFKRSEVYPALSVTTSATHDLPTIKGYWLGRDLEQKRRLNLYSSQESQEGDFEARAKDRILLAAALNDHDLLPSDFPGEDISEQDAARQLIVAMERFLARSPSLLLKINLDDLLEETDQINLPGTVAEYPNWRRK
ncbi:MAG: 4-alpha-glucanotransferase, partial [Rhodospirillales bacterium RIFCSPLOWO2_12_FULL_58_28]